MILRRVVRSEWKDGEAVPGTDKLLGYMMKCPGCGGAHVIYTEADPHVKVRWQFKGNLEKPTFSPSVKVWWHEGPEKTEKVCHFFIRDGRVQFCDDSTHALAGKTVDMIEMEDSER